MQQVGWQSPLGWLRTASLDSPAHWGHGFPPVQVCVWAAAYLSYGWLESPPQHAASVGAAPHTLPPGVSPRTTGNTQPRAGLRSSTKCRELPFFSSFYQGLFFVCLFVLFEKKVISDISGLLRATHNVWFIHLDGHFADCICSFVEHLKETSATQSLRAHSSRQLQDQGRIHVICCPLGSQELVSTMACPKLVNKSLDSRLLHSKALTGI